MGGLLRARNHVAAEHPPFSEILPLHRPVPSLREYHVGDQVYCHGLWFVPAGQRVRVGRDEEIRPFVGRRPSLSGREREAVQHAAESLRTQSRPIFTKGKKEEAQQDLPQRARSGVSSSHCCGEKLALRSGDSLLLPPISGDLVPAGWSRFDRGTDRVRIQV